MVRRSSLLLPLCLVSLSMPVAVAAQPPTLLPDSIVRVRADNHFGVAKQHDLTPVFGAGTFSDSQFDSEIGTPATATNNATYEFSLSGGTAVMDIQTTQSHTVGSTGNLTEGFVHFTIAEPYVYELSGNWSGAGPDAGDAYQQRTFLRQFVSPFATIFLEDETRTGTQAFLYVNEGDDTGGSSGFPANISPPRLGVLAPGTYEFNYELETSDRDNDQAAVMNATGRVRLVLRKPLPPTAVQATTVGSLVTLNWTGSTDASSYQLEAGSAPGASNVFVGDIGAATQLSATVGTGTYYVRLRSRRGAALGDATTDVTFTIGNPGCSAPPPAPAAHVFTAGGLSVRLRWDSSPGATSYQLEAGSVTGAANLAVLNLGSRMEFQATVPAAQYFTRIRAVNACGVSAPSAEAAFTLACGALTAPERFTFTRPPGQVALSWQASFGAVGYVLSVGTTPGGNNIFVGSVGSGTGVAFPNTILPAGIYYLRLAAVGACGTSGPSTEIALTLP